MILKNTGFLIVFGCALYAMSAPVWAAKTLSSPYVTKGKTTVETKAEYVFDDGKDDDGAWEVEATIAHGVTDFWEVEVGGQVEDAGRGEDAEFTALSIENKFQLTEKGAYFVDAGVKVEYAHSVVGGYNEIGAELLLAKPIGAFMNKAEFGVEREIGDDADNDTGYAIAYALSYDVSETLAVGAEWYSDFGAFQDGFDEQGHLFGPVVYGETSYGLEYEAGVLAGISDSAPDAEVKFVLGYEF